MTKKINLAIVGATGTVGETMLSILEQRKFPIANLYLLASANSAGKRLQFCGEYIRVIDAASFDFSKADIGLFSAGAAVSKQYAPLAVEQGCIVIDNTSAFRLDADVPLVVPEVNAAAISQYQARRIIANPNCSTIQMLVAIKPIYDAVGINRINVATYQAVSGSGKQAIDELAGQVGHLLNGRTAENKVYSQRIAFNVLPEIDGYEANGYTREEMKMVWETQKVLDDAAITVNPTAVRVPVFFGHSEAIHLETAAPISVERVRELLAAAPGVTVVDERKPGGYPSAAMYATAQDDVFVGRIRADISHPNGINLWVVADNVRKGAALNAVQIAEQILNEYAADLY